MELGRDPTFHEIVLPHEKAEIEAAILQAGLATAALSGQDPYQLLQQPTQNDENHFDFTLRTAQGEEYLDLMEAAPLQHYGGSYEAVPQVLNVGELAAAVYELVLRKNAKYQGIWARPIHLLLYTTDWRLSLPPSVMTLLAHWFRTKSHGFATVAYFLPAGVVRPHWCMLFPSTDPELDDIDESQVAQRVAARIDPSEISKDSDGTTVLGHVRVDVTNLRNARLAATGHIEFGEFAK